MNIRTIGLVLLCIAGLAAGSGLSAQDYNLANQYFANGEYEKAAAIYEQILEKEQRNEYFFNRYIDCLFYLEKYDEGEKALKKQIKKEPENAALYVTYGNLLLRQSKDEDAKTQFRKGIEKVSADFASINRLATAFMAISQFDYAIETYEQGGKLLRDPYLFSYNLGELYRRKGEPAKMIEQYLRAVENDPGKFPQVQTLLARFLAPGDFTELQTQLYARIQATDNPDLVELLAWSFIQKKDYKSALRQYKALDKRLGENGQRVIRLAEEAQEAQDYDAAIAGYDYVITEKGKMNPFFFDAKQAIMECRRAKITQGFNFTREDLLTLETDYEGFLAQFGRSKQTANIIVQQAELEALYINNLPKAIALLEEVKSMPGIEIRMLARIKINLADYYLMNGDIWESTLLYSQVDKDFKEEQIGQEARFKNARLSYYNGDFQWAQAQFDVLKASTSKLIANDALDLSVFIMDNLNLDTTSEAISLYSGAELLIFQNRFDEAFLKLDTLRTKFKEHSLQDDILYLEAQVFEKKREFTKAVEWYQKIVDNYKEDIRADNSLYNMAQIYETKLKDPEKAKSLYEKLFIDYSGSVFAVEARKRYRILRGEKPQ
jgi:tetratricopeptide (TPR) repeat protein